MAKARKRSRSPKFKGNNSYLKQQKRQRVEQELKDWGKGRPALITTMAWEAATMAEGLHVLVRMFTTTRNRPERMPTAPPIHEWLRLYHRHNRVQNVFGTALGLPENGPGSATWWIKQFAAIERAGPEKIREQLETADPEELKESIQFGKEFSQAWVDDSWKLAVAALHNEDPDDDMTDEQQAEWISRGEVQFYFRVWFPCFAEYRTTPVWLFREARRGCVKAIDKLVRIDKSIICDRIIREHWHGIMHANSQTEARKLRKALSSGPKGNMSVGQFKRTLAAIVSGISNSVVQTTGKHKMELPSGEVVNWNVTEKDISQLFGIIARYKKHTHPDTDRDKDLPKDSLTFTRALHRERTDLLAGGLIPRQKID